VVATTSQVRMTFGFSLYVVSLLATLVTYFEMKLENLTGEKLPEDSKLYYC